jgi:D-glycerate 3-kinase
MRLGDGAALHPEARNIGTKGFDTEITRHVGFPWTAENGIGFVETQQACCGKSHWSLGDAFRQCQSAFSRRGDAKVAIFPSPIEEPTSRRQQSHFCSGALDAVLRWLDLERLPQPGKRLLLGLCGAQGSGKTTLSNTIAARLGERGILSATLSLDDLYLTHAGRQILSRDIHPLLSTRGVPGTHDVALGMALFADFFSGRPLRLPRFDKSIDDRAPETQWDQVCGDIQVLIFEGWCVGAAPQSEAALQQPVNALERDHDPDGLWRRYVNDRLASDYASLFQKMDKLILLAAPGFEIVGQWRGQQEEELKQRLGAGAPGIMDAASLDRFISHYERLTRHILAEMPQRADLTIALAANRSVIA